MAGVPTAMTSLHDLETKFFYIMTSQRDNTMRIRRRATLEYVKRIDATRYVAPCKCHAIRHIYGNDVLRLREVWYVIFFSRHANGTISLIWAPQYIMYLKRVYFMLMPISENISLLIKLQRGEQTWTNFSLSFYQFHYFPFRYGHWSTKSHL